jgi:hypothetical protein
MYDANNGLPIHFEVTPMAKKTSGEAAQEQEGNGKVTKADAVRAAVAEGVNAPAEIVEFVKTKYGLELTAAQASTYKSLDKKRGGTGKRRGGRKVRAKAVATPNSTIIHGMVAIEDLEAAKQLVAKVGAEQAKRLVGLFE